MIEKSSVSLKILKNSFLRKFTKIFSFFPKIRKSGKKWEKIIFTGNFIAFWLIDIFSWEENMIYKKFWRTFWPENIYPFWSTILPFFKYKKGHEFQFFVIYRGILGLLQKFMTQNIFSEKTSYDALYSPQVSYSYYNYS